MGPHQVGKVFPRNVYIWFAGVYNSESISKRWSTFHSWSVL